MVEKLKVNAFGGEIMRWLAALAAFLVCLKVSSETLGVKFDAQVTAFEKHEKKDDERWAKHETDQARCFDKIEQQFKEWEQWRLRELSK